MKIKAYSNTNIKPNQIININDLEFYLKNKEYTNLEIKASKITATVIVLPITDKINNFDFFIIENFPYYNKKNTYWNLINKDFQNNTEETTTYLYALQIQPFLTFSFKEMFNDNIADISNMHINEFDQFENYEELILKDKNYFQNDLMAPTQLSYQSTMDNNIILSNDEKIVFTSKEKINFEWTNKWVIAEVKQKDGSGSSIIEPKVRSEIIAQVDKPDRVHERLQTETFYSIFPFPKSGDAYADIVLITTENEKQIALYQAVRWKEYRSNPNVNNIIILDYAPSNNIKTISGGGGQFPLWEMGKGFKGIKNDVSGQDWLQYEYLSNETVSTTFSTTKPLFNWIPETKNYKGNEEDNFKLENSIYINFDPYKNYNIGIFTESYNSGWAFTLNFNRSLDTTKFLFDRIFNPALNIFELIDDRRKNTYINNALSKTKRNLLAPQWTDTFLKNNQNKMFYGLTDYLMPAAALGLAAINVPGAIVAGITAFGLGATKTFINRQNQKNTPDTATQAATELISELIVGYNTRSLIINKMPDYILWNIAFEYHKLGANFINKKIKLNNDFANNFYNTKQRFNFIKFSNLVSNRIFDNSIINLLELQKLILILGMQGLHFWNYKNEWSEILKNYIFNYNIKNPVNERKD